MYGVKSLDNKIHSIHTQECDALKQIEILNDETLVVVVDSEENLTLNLE